MHVNVAPNSFVRLARIVLLALIFVIPRPEGAASTTYVIGRVGSSSYYFMAMAYNSAGVQGTASNICTHQV
jgi:hypothetical protein